jgi:hypothetical protein
MEVFVMGIGKVLFQTVLKGLGKRNDAVFAALAIVNRDRSLVEVLGAEAEAIHQTQTASIHQLGGELPSHPDGRGWEESRARLFSFRL